MQILPLHRPGRALHAGWRSLFGAALAALAMIAAPAQAGLFDDDEARRAILDLRAKLDAANEQNRALKAEQERQTAAANEQIALLKRSVLELNNQLELMRTEMAGLRGQDEQIARDVAELQRRQKDIAQGVEERVRRLEPQKVSIDGKEFLAEQDEKRQFEDAIGVFRTGDFQTAATTLSTALQRWPNSGYTDSAMFWLGNAQYGLRQYKEAIATFTTLLGRSPTHPRAPEALLSIANCHAELKDKRSARKAIEDLIKAYPQSEAAAAGRERLAALK